jgi:hypothetical protein
MFAVAAIIHLYMVWKLNMTAFALVAVWALIAIAIANQHYNHTVYISAIITAIFIFVNTCFQMFKKRTAS